MTYYEIFYFIWDNLWWSMWNGDSFELTILANLIDIYYEKGIQFHPNRHVQYLLAPMWTIWGGPIWLFFFKRIEWKSRLVLFYTLACFLVWTVPTSVSYLKIQPLVIWKCMEELLQEDIWMINHCFLDWSLFVCGPVSFYLSQNKLRCLQEYLTEVQLYMFNLIS